MEVSAQAVDLKQERQPDQGHQAKEACSVNAIFREHGESYAANHRLTAEQRRVIRNLVDCRSGALGGHIEQCEACGTVHYLDHSCRDRHCPQCQGVASEEWLAVRAGELLPIPYFHTVFTVDHGWNPLLLVNQAVCYDLLFATASEVLKEFAQRYLSGDTGFLAVVHTWGQQLTLSCAPALHCDGWRLAGRWYFRDEPQRVSLSGGGGVG